jgi:hypothetical protein
MLEDDRRVLRMWHVDIQSDGSRAFVIDKAVVCYFTQVLPLCLGVQGLREVMIAGDVIC